MKAHKILVNRSSYYNVWDFLYGYRGLKEAHKYFAFGSLVCMIMSVLYRTQNDFGKEESKKTGGSKRGGGIIHVRSRNKGARFCIAGSEWRNT